jgi:uncharacterized integral membrane protein (TIGR00697 family)
MLKIIFNYMKQYKYIDIITALFVTTLLLSNIASSAKIIDLGINILGLQLLFDAGTLVFPVSYIIGDVLTEVYGYKKTRRIIWIGFGCAVLTLVLLYVVGKLPGEEQWQQYAGDNAYGAILGSMASGTIVLASLSAYLLGEFSNSYLLAKLKIAMKGAHLWVRTIGSTLIGQAIDTVAFISIACALGVFPWEIALGLILANYIFKVAIEIAFTPITYKVINFLKAAELEDVYDTNTNFNPLKLS